MKIVCMSDMHSMYRQVNVPQGDVLVIAGDILGHGSFDELVDFKLWLADQPFDHKVVIAGNHDSVFEDAPLMCKEFLDDFNTIYLHDDFVIIDGIKFYGSPFTPNFFNWHFMLDRFSDDLKRKWEIIPDDTDVLITHGPPWGVLDEIGGRNVGCELLMQRVLTIQPKLHIFGHIHAGYGEKFRDGTHFINAAICTERYRPNNLPIVVET